MTIEPFYPDCPACGWEHTAPDGQGGYHCNMCGADMDHEGELIPYYDDCPSDEDVSRAIEARKAHDHGYSAPGYGYDEE